MIPRLIVFFPAAAVAVMLLLNLEDRGRLAPVNQTYVEWLIANTRHGFETTEASGQAEKVVFLAVSDPDALVFEDWPLNALDYAILFNNLKQFDPGVVAVHPLLDLSGSGDLALRSVNRAALGLSSVILGVPAVYDPNEEFVDPIIRHVLTPLTHVSGDLDLALPFTGILGLPHERARVQRYLGFNHVYNQVNGLTDQQERPDRAVLAARLGDDLYPSLALETALLHARTPLASTRFRLGQGAGVFIRDDRFIPLNADGSLDLPDHAADLVVKVDAAELLTAGGPIDQVSPDGGLLEALRGNIAVIGYDDPASRTIELADGSLVSPAELTARTIATMVSMPSIMRLPMPYQYLVAGIGMLLCLVCLRLPRRRAMTTALLFAFLNILAGFLVFQVVAVWWSLTVPVTLFALAGLVGLLVPLRRLRSRASDDDDQPEDEDDDQEDDDDEEGDDDDDRSDRDGGETPDRDRARGSHGETGGGNDRDKHDDQGSKAGRSRGKDRAKGRREKGRKRQTRGGRDPKAGVRDGGK